ncbi:SCF ubiquitin ligase complex subunit [Polyrhizophydium stewartii]|uniref:SCF ubiquitin ligase complex subunit n=1 Tax=Polyrhizophydium stewartii TaxID=2732419 RepID=A0ABR4N732_9FUNG
MDISIRGFLENHILFKDYASNTDFIDTLANLMKTRVFSDGAFVIRKGEVGRAMFFVLRGEVEVVSEDGETIINILREQSFFGEIGLLFSVPRHVPGGGCSDSLAPISILLTLTKESLSKAVAPYPRIALSIAQIAEERFSSHIKQTDSAMNVEFGEELKVGITQNDLKSIPLFRDCEVGFLHNLAMSLKPVQYTNANLIISKGEIASEMFFVVRGIAEVFNETTGQVFAQFHPGSFFGEVGLFFRIKRSASVRCNTPEVTVFKLMRTDLDSVLMNYPEVRQKIEAEAAQRFKFIESREKANLDKEHHEITDIEVIREQLKTIPIFKDTSIGFLHQLALAAKLHVYHEGKIIIRKGEIGSMMYFVIDGAVQVVSEDFRTVYAEMATNSFFGEVSLFFDVNRTATVRANCKTTLLQLSKESLHEVLMQYPAIKGPMHIKAEQNYELYRARQKTLQLVSTSAAHREQFDIETTTSRLKSVPVFNGCEEGFLRVLALSTSIRSLRQGDFIVRVGEDSCEMYFVVQGQVEIVSDDGKNVFDEVLSGGFFGEVGVIRGIKRTASVRVKSTVCDLIVLSSDAMRKALNEYPDSFQSVMLEAQKRFQLVENRTLRVEHALANVLTDSPHSGSANSHIQHTAIEAENAQEVKRSAEKERSRPFGQLFSRHSRKKPAELEPSQLKQVMTTSQDSISDPVSHRGMHFHTPAQPTAPASSSGQQTLSAAPATQQRESLHSVRPLGREAAPASKDSDSKAHRTLGRLLSTLKSSLHHDHGRSRSPSLTSSHSSTKAFINSDKLRDDVLRRLRIPPHKPITSILDANEQQLQLIFSGLSPIDILRLRGVCRRWNELLLHPHFWSKLMLRSEFRKINRKVIEVFGYLGGESLIKIDLTGCWMVFDDDIRSLVTQCTNIKALSVSNCWKLTDAALGYIAQKSSHLINLNISYCGQMTGSGFTDHVWRGLRKINLSYCKQIGDEQLEKLLSRTTELQDIKMHRCQRISDFGIFLIVRYCRRLRSLDLRDMDQISDRCLKWIASSCFNLVDLNLAFCLRITNSGLYDLSLGSQSFQRLDFSTCVQLTDASIVFFSDSIRSLRSISLRQCKNMTDGVTLYLAKTSPKLKFVDVTGCPNITSISKIQLQTYIEGVAIRIDQSPASRGIVQPCQSGRPRATEVSLREVFTSGPRDSMLAVRKTKRGLSSSVAKALRATSSPKTADPGAERARLVSPMPPPGAASNGRRSRNSSVSTPSPMCQ